MNTAQWPVCGHQRDISLLVREIADNSVRHAYLLTGPERVGKTTLARAFAAALVCEQGRQPGVACGRCDGCRRVGRGIHPDVQTFSLETQRLAARDRPVGDRLSVETAREISSSAAYRPYSSRYRVIIVEDAETLTEIAQEAMLKTLEEPPPVLVLMLIADRMDSLKPTIRSRCEHVNLSPVAASAIEDCLRARDVDAEAARALALHAAGLPGWALTAVDNPALVDERRESLTRVAEWVTNAPFQRVARAFELAGDYGKQRDRVISELETTGHLWRGVMMERAGLVAPDNELVAEQIAPFDLDSLLLGDSLRALESVIACVNDLEHNVRPRLALEAMVTQWPTIYTTTQ